MYEGWRGVERWIKVEGLKGVGRRGVKEMTDNSISSYTGWVTHTHTHIHFNVIQVDHVAAVGSTE